MPPASGLAGRRGAWLRGPIGVFLGAAGVTLLHAALLVDQRQLEFRSSLALSTIRFGLLALVGIPIWRYCERLLESDRSRFRVTAGHAFLAVGGLVVWLSLFLPLSARLYGQTLAQRVSAISALHYLEFGLMYTVFVAGIVAVQLSRRLDAQRREAAELLALAREAELRALKAQIRPHFLFNVLNSIYSLIGSRPEEAREMVDLVADLMRRTLDASEEEVMPVEWEMQMVDRYLRIEKVRIGNRLDIEVDGDALPKGEKISPLLLQPLVENALKHGVGARPGPGRIEVHGLGGEDYLEFVVRDTGPGIVGNVPDVPGHGLNLTRRRLEALYGGAFSLEMCNLQPRGFEVRLRLPRMAAPRTGGSHV